MDALLFWSNLVNIGNFISLVTWLVHQKTKKLCNSIYFEFRTKEKNHSFFNLKFIEQKNFNQIMGIFITFLSKIVGPHIYSYIKSSSSFSLSWGIYIYIYFDMHARIYIVKYLFINDVDIFSFNDCITKPSQAITKLTWAKQKLFLFLNNFIRVAQLRADGSLRSFKMI